MAMAVRPAVRRLLRPPPSACLASAFPALLAARPPHARALAGEPSAEGRLSAALMAMEDKRSAQNYAPMPAVLKEAKGVWAQDVDGRTYMDFLSAYSAVNQGH